MLGVLERNFPEFVLITSCAVLLVSQWDYKTFSGSTGANWNLRLPELLGYNRSALMAYSIAWLPSASLATRLGRAISSAVTARATVLGRPLVLAGIGGFESTGWASTPFSAAASRRVWSPPTFLWPPTGRSISGCRRLSRTSRSASRRSARLERSPMPAT